jgi:tetratricopeptide (TPR) repeat protein/uncharacterized integral membrane protein
VSTSPDTDDDLDYKKARNRLVWTFIIVAGLVVLFTLLAALRWAGSCAALRVVSAFGGAGLIYLAASLGGSLLGFLFGIPRSLQSDKPTTGSANGDDGHTQQTNTNLEQISDWLTKILVGVGLTQLPDLGQGVLKVARHLTPALGVPQSDESGVALTAALVVSGTLVGFLFAYIHTRTFISMFFARSTRREHDLSRAIQAMRSQPLETDLPGREVSNRLLVQAREVAAKPLSTFKTFEDLAGAGKARFWTGDRAGSAEAFGRALDQQPDSYGTRRDYGRALVSAGKVEDGIVELATAKRAAETSTDELADAIAIDEIWANLYRLPNGYEEAIKLAHQLIERNPKVASNPRLQTYLACAYGQAHAAAEAAGQKEVAADMKRKILAAIDATLAAPDAQGWKALLRSVWRPPSGSDDDDLASLKDDPDVAARLGP